MADWEDKVGRQIYGKDWDKPAVAEEHSDCLLGDCGGKYQIVPQGDCLCHMNPPCWACTNARLVCDECGEYGDDEDE